MDSFNTTDLRGLLRDASQPCVSIYLPTRVAAPDHHQNPTALKNLLRRAEAALPGNEEGPSELLRLAWKLVDDDKFWRGRGAGLAIFASPSQFRSFRVPVTLPELVEVNEHFVLRPLFPLLTTNSRCLILAISRNLVRLFEATRYEIRNITPAAMPTDLKSALNNDQIDRGSQSHSAMRGTLGKQAAVFHGQGGQDDTIKEETARFFRLVDASLQDLGTERSLPLVLAGVDADVALFRSITRHSPLADEQVHGNMDHLSDYEVHQSALPALTAFSSRQQQTAMSRLQEADRGRAANSLRDILPAVYQGRIDTLFVRGTDRQWGEYFPDSGLVQLHGVRQPGDDDLLEVAAIETACHGGTVFTLEADELSGDSPVAAIFRY
jgi:hypothetical protein